VRRFKLYIRLAPLAFFSVVSTSTGRSAVSEAVIFRERDSMAAAHNYLSPLGGL
jgi:hypothetical protein